MSTKDSTQPDDYPCRLCDSPSSAECVIAEIASHSAGVVISEGLVWHSLMRNSQQVYGTEELQASSIGSPLVIRDLTPIFVGCHNNGRALNLFYVYLPDDRATGRFKVGLVMALVTILQDDLA